MVEFLLSQGANIHAQDDKLYESIYNGSVPVVEFLVSRGANIHAQNDLTLSIVTSKGNLPMI